MKTLCRFATFVLLLAVSATWLPAQATDTGETKPTVTVVLANLIEGQGSLPGNTSDWEGWSELTLIPGAGMFAQTGKTTVLTLGFSAGSTVNIANMVLYTTARGSNNVTAVKKVTLGKKANPSINLLSTTVCPNQPVSVASPCFVALDSIAEALSPLNDYYFVEYFTSDSENQTMRGAGSASNQGALNAWQIDGDDTRIPVGGTIPVGYTAGSPIFLTYVTNIND